MAARICKIPENANESVVTADQQVAWQGEKKGTGEGDYNSGARCVHSLGCRDGLTSVKMYQIIHFKRVLFTVLQSYLN